MAIGIDISGDALRHSVYDGDQSIDGVTRYGICGIPPRIHRERFLWNVPKAARATLQSRVLKLMEAWRAYSLENNATFTWPYDNGSEGNRSMPDLVAEALCQNLPQCRGAQCIVTIGNLIQEKRQEALLNALAGTGVTDVKLLWRPIALAMSFLEEHRVGFFPGERLLIIDADCLPVEATLVELAAHPSDGSVVPLRKMPSPGNHLDVNFDIAKVRQSISLQVAHGDAFVAQQLMSGAFSHEFIASTELKPCGDIWCQRNGHYFRIDIDSPKFVSLVKTQVNNGFLKHLIEEIKSKFDFNRTAAVIWHGWPFRVIGFNNPGNRHYLTKDSSVCRGAALYGSRLSQGLPTYLDTLPGLYVLSEVKELGTHCFFHLIKPSVIEGGRSWKRKAPLTRFSVRKGIKSFTAVLRKSDEDRCRKVITPLPRTPKEDTPVLINAETKPASGYAKVTIEGAEKNCEVFGDNRMVRFNWEFMEDVDIPIVFAPEVYPVKGRLFDDDDPEQKEALKNFLAIGKAKPYEHVKYRDHDIAFHTLLEPWGFAPPWHTGRGLPDGWTSEPTRGMFGSLKLPVDSETVDQVAISIQGIMHQDRVKFLNYMFVYAPESFKQELRDKFSQDEPSFVERVLGGRPRPSWNWVIAPGRVFSTADDFELFVDFIIKHGKSGYPEYPDSKFTKHYWWSFFRCLCYYTDTVNIAPEKILVVLKMIHDYIAKGNPDTNALKYCLCAILFSLRLRHLHPDFLQPVDELCQNLMLVIKKIPKIPYPPSMLAVVQDPNGGGLNGLVLRFLMQTANTEDCRALEGLTTSMA
jgi:hypothetical protein